MIGYKLKPLSLAILTASLALPVAAQQVAEEETLHLEEIVVTARQREESLQKVPVAVNSFSAKDIARQGVNDTRDLLRLSPGVVYESSGSIATGSVNIRGVSQPGLIGDETNVAVFVDGVYYSGRDATFMPLNGIERVEVLRGPQSALYGRNAFAGAINYVTEKPGSEFKAGAEATYGDSGRQGVKGFISVPMGDMFAARLDAVSDRSGSTFEDGDKYLGSIENNSQRLRLMFTPTENLEFDLSYAHIDMQEEVQPGFEVAHNAMYPLESNAGRGPLIPDMSGFNPIGYNPITGIPSNGAIISGAPESFAGEVYADTPDGAVDGATGTAAKSDRINLTINWDVGDVLLTSITGQSKVETRAVSGYDTVHSGTSVGVKTAESEALLRGPMPGNPATDYLAIPVFSGGGTTVYASGIVEMATSPFSSIYLMPTTGQGVGGQPNDDRVDFSQEFRIQSTDTGPLQWSAGALYAETDLDQWLWVSVINPTNDLSAKAIEISGTGLINGDPKVMQLTEHNTTTTSAFASIGYDFTDKLNVTVEGRYTKEDKTADNTIDNRAPGFLFPTGYDEADWAYFTPRVTASYQVDEDTMYYVNIAQGTKSGGINGGAAESELFYDPEVNTSFEFGRKKAVLEGRGYFNIAAYYIDWQDQQIRDFSTVTQSGTLPAVVVTNLGQTRIMGLELETAFQIDKNWSFHGAYTFSDSEIIEGQSGPMVGFTDYEALGQNGTPFPGCISTAAPVLQPDGSMANCAIVNDIVSDGDVSGNQSPNSHRNTLTLGLKYSRDFNGAELYANVDGVWKDKRFVDSGNTLEISSYYDVNGRIGLQGDNWYGSVWASNLLDDDTASSAYRPYVWNGEPQQTFINRMGRTLGLTVGYNF